MSLMQFRFEENDALNFSFLMAFCDCVLNRNFPYLGTTALSHG